MALIYDTSMPLDGFITGPSPRPSAPLGDGGDVLHDWMSGIADLSLPPRDVTHLGYRVLK